MTVTGIETDEDALTLTLTAEFAASLEQVWTLWSDRQQLEKWWGPPEYPATFRTLELRPGGSADYYMTGPDGERYFAQWDIDEVSPRDTIRYHDHFAHEDGSRDTGMPVSVVTVRFTEHDGTTRMVITTRFGSREDLQKLLGMEMAEGFRQAVSQMDALLPA